MSWAESVRTFSVQVDGHTLRSPPSQSVLRSAEHSEDGRSMADPRGFMKYDRELPRHRSVAGPGSRLEVMPLYVKLTLSDVRKRHR